MLPVILNPDSLVIALTGAGEGLERRRALLDEAGIAPVALSPGCADEALIGVAVLFIVGLPQVEAAALTARARRSGALVNVEDVPALCDFHVPAVIRRGDLLLTVSTGGRAPGLARAIRQWLTRRIGREWGSRLDEVAAARAAWRTTGHSLAEVSRRTGALVAEKGWLS